MCCRQSIKIELEYTYIYSVNIPPAAITQTAFGFGLENSELSSAVFAKPCSSGEA